MNGARHAGVMGPSCKNSEESAFVCFKKKKKKPAIPFDFYFVNQ